MRASICALPSPASPRCAIGPPTAARAGARLAAALHIDTGINRLGMSESEVEQLASEPDLLATFETTLVMSHLACADEPGNPMNAQQRDRFNMLRAKLPPAPASLSNSGGTFLGCRIPFRSRQAGDRTLRRTCARKQTQPDAHGCAARGKDSPGARGACRRHGRLRRHLQSAASLAHRHHRLRLCRRLLACPERCHRRVRPRRLYRRLSRAHRWARVDGQHHCRRDGRARGTDAARRMGGSHG